MCNKMFSLNFGMDNPDSSTFLGNVWWKLVKQLKNSDFHSIYHNATVTVNLFENFRNTSRNVFDMCNKVWKLVKQLKNQ